MSDENRFPFRAAMAGVDFPFSWPRLSLPAHMAWRRAHERGLVSDEEFRRYEALVESLPFSWMGWLREPAIWRRQEK